MSLRGMIKKSFKISAYSIILFCSISFLSLLFSIINNKIDHTFPNFEIGFPFTIYYQFQIKNECGFELQYGSNIKYSIYNFLLCLLLMMFLSNLKFSNIKQLNNK